MSYRFQNIIAAFAVVLVITASATVSAGKIAVFDPEMAILSTDAAKARFEKVKKDKEFKKLEKQIKGYEADIKSMQKESEKNRLTWSDTQKQEFQKKLSYVYEDRELALKKVATEQKQIVAELNQKYAKKMEEATKKLIESQDIDLLVKPGAVWHVKPALNLTPQVVRMLNEAK